MNRIILKKRKEMMDMINKFYEKDELYDALDIGTTNDMEYYHSNFLIKNLKNIKAYKSISNQKIDSSFFIKTLNKSILEKFSTDEIDNYSSDLVLSNATIEHVGNSANQLQMISNIIALTKKNFVLITPNRSHPIDFHTQIPVIHWLPKKIHRKILSLIGLKFYSKEENLNLLSTIDLVNFLNNFDNIEYEIRYIKFLGFKSNCIIFGKLKTIKN
tara:strand:- start:420 stop:1064 length:645 start_codon:yes stop_codon:yes gene_type:complete